MQTYEAETFKRHCSPAVIGGGVAGVGAALKLAEEGYHVTLFERDVLFSGSSGRNPGRMGHGFHYMDIPTAITYLQASIKVQKLYPDYIVGAELPPADPIRHGRYYILKTSLLPFAEMLVVYRAIQAEYHRLVLEDPTNEVFGPPDSFFRVLERSEYELHINADLVEGAVETNEHLFDWPKFARYMRDIIRKHPRIRLVEHAQVLGIQRGLDAYRFGIQYQQGRAQRVSCFSTNFIVNCAWENIEHLNATVGIPYVEGTRTNRLKCLLEVELPSELHRMNSAFFCIGSFCMFSNMGDGRGMMTLADVTNLAVSSELRIDEDMEAYLRGDIAAEHYRRISDDILEGVAKYIPQMRAAKVIGLKFGIVQTEGKLELSNLALLDSAHHRRADFAVCEQAQGLISSAARKLFYWLDNAELVWKIFQRQIDKEMHMLQLRSWLEQFVTDFGMTKNIYSRDWIVAVRCYLDWVVDMQILGNRFIWNRDDPVLQKLSEALECRRAVLDEMMRVFPDFVMPAVSSYEIIPDDSSKLAFPRTSSVSCVDRFYRPVVPAVSTGDHLGREERLLC